VGGVWRGLVGAAGAEAGLEQLSYLRDSIFGGSSAYDREWVDHPQELNLIKERFFLLSGAGGRLKSFVFQVWVELIMAGNYFHDPRPFYGLGHTNLVPLDEVRDPKYYDPSIFKSPKSWD
jgi:hypothetical protein